MGDPLISVIMPVRNARMFLGAAIRSILFQRWYHLELIIIDDGSSDDSAEIARRFAVFDPRISVHSIVHGGIGEALNVGLSLARGSLVARMDADDVSLPQRLSQQVQCMQRRPLLVAVGTQVLLIDAQGRWIGEKRVPVLHGDIVEQLKRGDAGALIHPTVLFRRDTLDRVGHYSGALSPAEDLDLYLRLIKGGEVANLDAVGLLFRQHLESASHQNREQQRRGAFRALVTHGLASDTDDSWMAFYAQTETPTSPRRKMVFDVVRQDMVRESVAQIMALSRELGAAEAASTLLHALWVRLRHGRRSLVASRALWRQARIAGDPIRIDLLCSGAGHIRRGFESFYCSALNHFSGDPRFSVRLLSSGRVPSAFASRVNFVGRRSALVRLLCHIGVDAYRLEQACFVMGVLVCLLKRRPSVILFSDPLVGNLLWWFRRMGFPVPTVVLNNGGPLTRGLERWDAIQEVTPQGYARSVRLADTHRVSLVPYGFSESRVRRRVDWVNETSRSLLILGTPSFGHKRVDLILRVLALLRDLRWSLTICGEHHPDGPAVIDLARDLGIADRITLISVPPGRVPAVLFRHDIMLHAAQTEGFPRAVAEAAFAGLWCMVQDTPIHRYVLGLGASYVDYESLSVAAGTIRTVITGKRSDLPFSDYVERFTWDRVYGQLCGPFLESRRTPQEGE